MMKKLGYAAAITLLANGMVFAQLGDLPAARVDTNENGREATVSPEFKLPGVVGTQETPTAGVSTKGIRPGVGVGTEELGSVAPSSASLPGVYVSGM